MRAVVFERFGEPGEVLSVRDLPTPRPAHGEIRVRMLASPVNPSDVMTVRGEYGRLPELPATPGFEGVGVVEEAGGGMFGKYLVGKRVGVINRGGGCWAEQTVIPATSCLPLSKSLPLEQAAMFFVNPTTAYVMTRRVLAVGRGEWLMQSAAGSSLGKMVIRLGRHSGFPTLNIVRRREQAEQLRELGADATVVFDEADDDPREMAKRIREATGGMEIRYAIDPVGGPTASGMIGALGDASRMLVFGSLSTADTCFSSRDLLMRNIRIEGFWLAQWMRSIGIANQLRTLRSVTKLIKAGVLANDVGPAFPLEKITEAVGHSETRGRAGKAWLRIDGE